MRKGSYRIRRLQLRICLVRGGSSRLNLFRQKVWVLWLRRLILASPARCASLVWLALFPYSTSAIRLELDTSTSRRRALPPKFRMVDLLSRPKTLSPLLASRARPTLQRTLGVSWPITDTPDLPSLTLGDGLRTDYDAPQFASRYARARPLTQSRADVWRRVLADAVPATEISTVLDLG